MKNINYLSLIFLFLLGCIQNNQKSSQNYIFQEDKLSIRDSLIIELHSYQEKKVKESKSQLFSISLVKYDKCYWIDYAIKDYYFDEFKKTLSNSECNDSLRYLNIASRNCNTEVVNYLLIKGVNPNKGVDGIYPLHFTLMNHLSALEQNPTDDTIYLNLKILLKEDEFKIAVIKNLLEFGADPNIKDKYGKTAIDYTNNDRIKKILVNP
ncbi:MAG: hypothetical protein ACK5IC_10885 [Moheibacter sp.]